MSTNDVSMKQRVTIAKELKRLSQIVTNIAEANGFGVLCTFTRSYISRTLNCGSFNIEIYIYPHLADTTPHIWINRNTSEIDNFDSLADQLRLAGFEVGIVIEHIKLRTSGELK